jgi:hypothetical protein
MADGSAAPAAAEAPTASIKVLLLPSDLKIYNLTAGGSLDIQPDASDIADKQADADLQQMLPANGFQLVTMPSLSPDEQQRLKESVALYRLASEDAKAVDNLGGDWKQAIQRFDYSVGPNLQFLKQRTGADYALIVFGADADSTGGRVAMSIFFAALGVGIAGGRNYMYAGLADLNTGDIVWLDDDHKNASNFTDKKAIDAIIRNLLQDYPSGSLHDSSATPETLQAQPPKTGG